MRIESVWIRNYRSFRDSGEITLSPGWNLIVGANNVGKSSLLDCLSGRFSASPHRSLVSLPTVETVLNPWSESVLTFVASGSEFRHALVTNDGQHRLPWVADLAQQQDNIPHLLQKYFESNEIRLRVKAHTASGTPVWAMDQFQRRDSLSHTW